MTRIVADTTRCVGAGQCVLTDPTTFDQDSTHGTEAYMPVAIRNVMPYWTFALWLTEMTPYPIIAMGSVNNIITPRSASLSDSKAMKTVQTAATAYGGTVQS